MPTGRFWGNGIFTSPATQQPLNKHQNNISHSNNTWLYSPVRCIKSGFLRYPDNKADLKILKNRSYLVKIHRIENITPIFGFRTLVSLLWLENVVRNLFHTSKIWIFEIRFVQIRKISGILKIINVNPILIIIILFTILFYCLFIRHFSWPDWLSKNMMWVSWSVKEHTISQRILMKYIWVMGSI
jgi:hypothetical protein